MRACDRADREGHAAEPDALRQPLGPASARATAYPRFDDFMADVVAILVDEVRELRRLGCRYVQLDAPHYPLLIDPRWRAFYEQRGWTLERWLSYGVELDNAVIGAGAPDDVRLPSVPRQPGTRAGSSPAPTTRSRPRSSAPIARPAAAARVRRRALGKLRRAGERARGQARRARPRHDQDRRGSSAQAELEARIAQAARVIGLERLALGTQCGFATSVARQPAQRRGAAAQARAGRETAAPVWG